MSVGTHVCLLPAVLLLSISGCNQGDGFVEGDYLEVADCQGSGKDVRFEPFRMNLESMGLVKDKNVLSLRFSNRPAEVVLTDLLAVTTTIDGNDALGGVLSGPIDGDIFAVGLALLNRCPQASASLEGTNGVATFTRLGVDEGDRVTGELMFDVLDTRSDTIVGERFFAEFDFEVIHGQPQSGFAPN